MNQRKILLLENVALQAAGVRQHLSGEGFQVAVNRYEAGGLKRLEEWRPDLVLVSTTHPAGDFVEYCRRIRALAPGARIVVTSPLDRGRLFQEHPALQTIVDGVLLRPYGHEEVSAMIATIPIAPRVPAAGPALDPAVDPASDPAPDPEVDPAPDPAVDPDNAELRAEFQCQLDARFLELEELKRRLRQDLEEARSKAALALATEQLRRSEIEVELENLLRVKEDLELSSQGEIEALTRELEQAGDQLRTLRDSSDKAVGEHAALRGELERALVEKEQLEERLHALEAAGPAAVTPPAVPPAEALRLASLEEELSRQRAQVAEGQVALADATARAAVLEEALAREQAAGTQSALAAASGRVASLEKELAAVQEARTADARLAQEQRYDAAVRDQELLERAEGAARRSEQLQADCAGLEERLGASEAARNSMAAEAEAVVTRLTTEVDELRARSEELNRELENLRTFKAEATSEEAVRRAEHLGRELAESRERARDGAAECERLTGMLAERERAHTAEVQTWRDRVEAVSLEMSQVRSQEAERAGRAADERRTLAERQEHAGRELAERELLVASLREELLAAEEARRREVRELETRVREAETASRVAGSRLEAAAAALVGERTGFEARERDVRLQLEAQQNLVRGLEEKLAARALPEAVASPVQTELHRIQELLEEVITRARTEVVDYARRDAELSTRLQAALDERRLLQERFDRVSVEATERERRSSSLLQSAIERGASPTGERANLPAVVPLDAGPGSRRWWPVLVGLAVATLVILLAVFALRRSGPSTVREQQPAVPRPQRGASPGAAATPREVWDRWTRSDSSGGVLVQATLRSEEELRAEVEADRAPGASNEEVRAEFARRLSAFRFDTTYYVTVYLKNFSSGYPTYLDNLSERFRLRDGSGREVPAFLPPGQEKDRRIFSFGAGPPGDLIYEASVSLGFDRAGLSPSAGYLQLVVSDVGAASRRVLTWELE